MKSVIDVMIHSSIRIEGDGLTIYVDPFKLPNEPKDGDFVLVTHEHYDHFSPEDIIKVSKEDTILVMPIAMKSKANLITSHVKAVQLVEPGNSYVINNLKFDTVPSYNINKQFHPKEAGWVGYIVEVEGERIYIAGDTDAIEEGKSVKCDIALVPVGGTYTMTAAEAASFVNTIKPALAIPTHYGSIVGEKVDGDAFEIKVDSDIKVEKRIK